MRALKTVVESKEKVAVELRERLAAAEAARDEAQARVKEGSGGAGGGAGGGAAAN